ncbi:hypothetical protein [Ahrensia sp. R2A130]|uniref:hypothetical protein n=1 Tax=Ahrensia sp. R2A130 TaxID=744979 RepID=UPI0001E0B519|nr:hypothetical protein [Ahrensia sp. R2A130]EFL88295.1 coat protein [Ahrensia sp. R2A130]
MATTRLTDVLFDTVFLPYTRQRIAEKSMLRNSGMASADAEIQAFANGPGNIVEMPFWNDIDGADNVSTDDPAQSAVPGKLTMGADQGRKLRRNYGIQVANLVGALTATDPMSVIADMIADYWDRREQEALLSTMTGVFADPQMAGNVLDVATEDGIGAPVKFDIDVATSAYSLLGEYGSDLTAMMVHSRVYYNLEAQRALVYEQDPVTGLQFATYNGRRIVMSDKCPKVAGSTSGLKYTSYLFGSGGIGYAEATGAGGPVLPVEFDSAPAAGNGEGVQTVWYRRHFVMHPRGVKFDGTIAGSAPTNAELANGANWTRVFDPRFVRMVAVVTNG